MKLHDALLGCSTGQLRRVAEAWGLPTEDGTLRQEYAEALRQTMVARIADEAFWDGLSPDARRVAEAVARSHGRHVTDLLVRRLVAGQPGSAEEAEARVVEGIARLTALGLLFRIFEAEGGLRRTVVALPDEVVEAVSACLVASPETTHLPVAAAPDQIAQSDVAHDLFVLASALRREALATSSRGLSGRKPRSVSQVLAALQAKQAAGPSESERRWQFLLWAGKRLGWFDRGSWPLPHDERLGERLDDRLAIVREVLGTANTRRPGQEADRGLDLAELHADALQVLSELKPAAWWPASELLMHIGDQLGLPWRDEGDVPLPSVTRRAREAVRRWLVGRWYWLGLVEWGRTGQEWSAVATATLLGEVVAGHAASVSSVAAPCQTGEPFQLLAPANADLATLYRCERYLAYRGGDAEERRYDVTPASVARGIRLGGDEEELLADLGRLLQRDLPATWTESVIGWCRARSSLRVEPRILLVASDEAALGAALNVEDARQAITGRLGTRHGLVAPDRLPALLTGLAGAGLPVEVDPALRVEPRRPGQAAALGAGVAEAAWIALDVLRRLGGETVAEQPDLGAAQRSLEASLSTQALEALERRARTIAALVSERRGAQRRPQKRKRVV